MMRRYWPHRVMRWALLACVAGGVLLWGCGGAGQVGTSATPAAPASVSKNADTVGLYGPAKGTFMLTASRHPNTVEKTFTFGPKKASMLVIAGDWNADKADEVGVYDPQASKFYLAERSGKAAAELPWGKQNAGWLPIAGDWDGDGRDGVGLYDPAQGMFRLRNSTSGQASEVKFRFGPKAAKQLPIAGDWDGDGKDTVGLFEPARGLFRLINSYRTKGGKSDLKFSVYPSQAGALPVTGDWNGDRKDSVGWYERQGSTFYLKNANTGGAAEVKIRLGVKGEKLQPIAGRW